MELRQGGIMMSNCSDKEKLDTEGMIFVQKMYKGRQYVVSDMTAFYVKGVYYELTRYMDLWNNEIVSHSLSSKRGDRMTIISAVPPSPLRQALSSFTA